MSQEQLGRPGSAPAVGAQLTQVQEALESLAVKGLDQGRVDLGRFDLGAQQLLEVLEAVHHIRAETLQAPLGVATQGRREGDYPRQSRPLQRALLQVTRDRESRHLHRPLDPPTGGLQLALDRLFDQLAHRPHRELIPGSDRQRRGVRIAEAHLAEGDRRIPVAAGREVGDLHLVFDFQIEPPVERDRRRQQNDQRVVEEALVQTTTPPADGVTQKRQLLPASIAHRPDLGKGIQDQAHRAQIGLAGTEPQGGLEVGLQRVAPTGPDSRILPEP